MLPISPIRGALKVQQLLPVPALNYPRLYRCEDCGANEANDKGYDDLGWTHAIRRMMLTTHPMWYLVDTKVTGILRLLSRVRGEAAALRSRGLGGACNEEAAEACYRFLPTVFDVAAFPTLNPSARRGFVLATSASSTRSVSRFSICLR